MVDFVQPVVGLKLRLLMKGYTIVNVGDVEGMR